MLGTCKGEFLGLVIALKIAVDFSCAADWLSESFICLITNM